MLQNNIRKELISFIGNRALELESSFSTIKLNGLKEGDKSFFIIVAFENVLQGLWDRSWDTILTNVDNRMIRVSVDCKFLIKVHNKLLSYIENSDNLYWDITFSRSLRQLNKLRKGALGNQKVPLADLIIKFKEELKYKNRRSYR